MDYAAKHIVAHKVEPVVSEEFQLDYGEIIKQTVTSLDARVEVYTLAEVEEQRLRLIRRERDRQEAAARREHQDFDRFQVPNSFVTSMDMD